MRYLYWTTLCLCLLAARGLGYAERWQADRVVVDKAERRLVLMQAGRPRAAYAIALGGSPRGHKLREGDRKTPEGVYRLDWRNAASSFHKSIHISYPDAEDRKAAASAGIDPGGMIMIHGQRNYLGWLAPLVQLFDWTDGCIAVTNAEMREIWAVVPDGTPIEIRP